MFDIIKSIYSTVKSLVKHNNTLSNAFFSSIEFVKGSACPHFCFQCTVMN